MNSQDLALVRSIIELMVTVDPETRPSALQLLTELFYHKNFLQLKARRLRDDGKYLESLQVWKQILDMNRELSDEEREEAWKAAWSIDQLLPEEEYSKQSSEAIVIYSELAISVLDRLLQTENNAEMIGHLLVARWSNDYLLLSKGKGLGSWDKMLEFYVTKVREAYARFSPAQPERIKKTLDHICRLENKERMQMEELQKLKEEVEASRENLEKMSTEERKDSEQWLSVVKRHLENVPRKNELKKKAKEEGEKGRFIERLQLWKQIIELNVELSGDERTELREACMPLEKLKSDDSTTSQEKCDHSDLAVSTIECYVRQALICYTGERSELFSFLWDNEEVLVKGGKLNLTVNERALRVTQLIKENYKKQGFFVDHPEGISLCAHFLAKMEDGWEKLAELKKLADEVEEWWKTYLDWKDAKKLAELSKVKAEVERLSKQIYRKDRLLVEARHFGEVKEYTKRLHIWKEILELNIHLTDEERIAARMAASSISHLLPSEEYVKQSSEAIVIHSELAISILDRLLQTEKKAEKIRWILAERWNNDVQLLRNGKGFGSSEKQREFYVKKAREAYARFSSAHPKRIKEILNYLCRLENNERMQVEELRKLNEELEAARGDLERMTEEKRKESEQWLSAVKRHLENIPKKNELRRRAKEEGEKGRFTERLALWKQILDLNVELSSNERTELREACQPLGLLMPVDFTTTQERCDHSDLAVSTIERYVRQALRCYTGERSELFSLLWENEEVLWAYKKINSTENKRAVRVIQLIKESYKRLGISIDSPEEISLCAHFLMKMEDGREKLAELKKLADEVEQVWKTNPTWKNDAKLAELLKVKAEVERLSKYLRDSPRSLKRD